MGDLNSTSSQSSWDFLFYELSDKRTIGWPLMKDPILPGSILIAYLYFVLSAGPRLMAKRKPFELKNILIVYNFLQVCMSVYLVYEGLDAAWARDYNWNCQPVDFSTSPQAMRIAKACYIYFLAKLTELLDTKVELNLFPLYMAANQLAGKEAEWREHDHLDSRKSSISSDYTFTLDVFFVLRKKDKQVTFLHMYHHTGMPMISWGTVKYFPGGHGTLIGLINSFVHIIMYSYYMLAAVGPGIHKYLWWKKYITTLQLAQFCLAFLHSAQLLWFDCGYPKFSLYFTMPNSVFFYFLFNDFYKKAYGTSDKTQKREKQSSEKSQIENSKKES